MSAMPTGREILNLCANNYLGLADDPRRARGAAARCTNVASGWRRSASSAGPRTSTASWRHGWRHWLGHEDTILFPSCFDANGGVFEALLDERDAVISDALNHASIIDGIRLCKAQRLRYANRDMADLEERLKEASDARYRLIVTDGVFSMDGYFAPLDEICALADATTHS